MKNRYFVLIFVEVKICALAEKLLSTLGLQTRAGYPNALLIYKADEDELLKRVKSIFDGYHAVIVWGTCDLELEKRKAGVFNVNFRRNSTEKQARRLLLQYDYNYHESIVMANKRRDLYDLGTENHSLWASVAGLLARWYAGVKDGDFRRKKKFGRRKKSLVKE